LTKLKTFSVQHTVLIERVYYTKIQCETWEEAKAWAQNLENFPERFTDEPSELNTDFDDSIIDLKSNELKRWSQIDG